MFYFRIYDFEVRKPKDMLPVENCGIVFIQHSSRTFDLVQTIPNSDNFSLQKNKRERKREKKSEFSQGIKTYHLFPSIGVVIYQIAPYIGKRYAHHAPENR